MIWALVPTVLTLGAIVLAVLVRRLDDSVRGLDRRVAGLTQVRLATVVVEDDLAALRAALADTPHR